MEQKHKSWLRVKWNVKEILEFKYKMIPDKLRAISAEWSKYNELEVMIMVTFWKIMAMKL